MDSCSETGFGRLADADGSPYEQGEEWAGSDFESLTTGGSMSDDTLDDFHLGDDDETLLMQEPEKGLSWQLTNPGIELLRRQRRQTEIRCGVSTVCYGRWMGKPACLVVFRSQYRTANESIRFRNASVRVNVRRSPTAGSHDTSPRSVHFFRTYDEKNNVERIFELTASFGDLKHAAADSTLKADSQVSGGIAWTVAENWAAKMGIPTTIDTAIIATLDESGQVAMEIKINTASTDSLDLTFPWSTPKSIIFSPDAEFGKAPLTLDFEHLSAADWKNIMSTDTLGGLTCPRYVTSFPYLYTSTLTCE